MSVNNIVNMAKLKGLEIIALTDHNSCKNCPAFLEVAKGAGIRALPGMEINTSEEVHAVCLFKNLADAMAFDKYVFDRLPDVENRTDVFGEQLLLDELDNVTGFIKKLLINAAGISFFELHDLMKSYNGLYFPAHVDRNSFSLTSNLGIVPHDCVMDAFELADIKNLSSVIEQNVVFSGLSMLKNSDAHHLWDISEAIYTLDDKLIKSICIF